MLYQHCQCMVQFFSHKKQEMTRRRQIMISSDVFARALLRLKTEDGISPVRFAADVGITYSTLNNIKRGRQSLSPALYKTIIAKYPQFERYASEEMQEPGIKSGEQLELKDIFRKFDASPANCLKCASYSKNNYGRAQSGRQNLPTNYLIYIEKSRKKSRV